MEAASLASVDGSSVATNENTTVHPCSDIGIHVLDAMQCRAEWEAVTKNLQGKNAEVEAARKAAEDAVEAARMAKESENAQEASRLQKLAEEARTKAEQKAREAEKNPRVKEVQDEWKDKVKEWTAIFGRPLTGNLNWDRNWAIDLH